MDPAVVRRVLRAAGIDPGPIRTPRTAPVAPTPACLADPAWLRAEYATKGARLGRAEGGIARELGCSHEHVYEALHAAGIPMRENGFYPKSVDQITPAVADRIVSLCLAGWSAMRIAAELGLSVQAVSRRVQRDDCTLNA